MSGRLLLSMAPGNGRGARHAVIPGRTVALCGWWATGKRPPYLSLVPVDCPPCASRIKTDDIIVTGPRGDTAMPQKHGEVPTVRVGTIWKSRDKREDRTVKVVSVSMSGEQLDAENTKTKRVTHMTTRVFVKTFEMLP